MTVTWSCPAAEIFNAGNSVVIPVGATNTVVGREAPFHRTEKQGSKLVPFTVSEIGSPAAVSTAALAGESELIITGDEKLVVGAVMEKLAEFDATAEFDTVMLAAPRDAVSAAVMAAASRVEFTNVVRRGEPFQLTTSPSTKFVPFTVSVMPVEPQYAVEVGESDVIAGATIENETALDVPPPGAGFTTVIAG